MKQLNLSPEAVQDLDDIWEHIASDSIDAADRFLARLQQQIASLAKSPGLGHLRQDLAEDRPIYFWPVGNYLILYRSTGGQVEVVAIIHGNRDTPAFIRRREL